MKIETVYNNRKNNLSVIKNDYLISFIVPIYNTEKYLVETLDSIVSAEFDNIEIVIVNDGSSDNSVQVTLNWVEGRSLPVLVLSQSNAGLSAARMTGLSHARGDYVCFLDSDDKIVINTYLKLARTVNEYDCDIGLCRSVVWDEYTQKCSEFYDGWLFDKILNSKSLVVVDAKREPRLFRLEPNANPKLTRRDFLLKNNISYPVGLHYEDLPVHVQSLAAARKVLILDSTGYYYRVNRIGKITDQKSIKRFDIIKVAKLAIEHANHYRLDFNAMANMLALICRMICWCGYNIQNKYKERYFIEASDTICRFIPRNVIMSCIDKWTDEHEGILVSALATKSIRFLKSIASGTRPNYLSTIPIILSKKLGKVARKVAVRVIKSKLKKIIKRY